MVRADDDLSLGSDDIDSHAVVSDHVRSTGAAAGLGMSEGPMATAWTGVVQCAWTHGLANNAASNPAASAAAPVGAEVTRSLANTVSVSWERAVTTHDAEGWVNR